MSVISPTARSSGFDASGVFERGYRALGYSFRIRTDLVPAARALDRALAPFRAAEANGGPSYSVAYRPRKRVYVASRGRTSLVESESLRQALDYVLWDVNSEAIRRTNEYLMIHAAVVAWKGRALVLPARMNSGKTTLSAGLLKSGFTYLTDEVALLDRSTGKVHPYPKALTLGARSLDAVGVGPAGADVQEGAPQLRSYHLLPGDIRPRAVARTPRLVRYVIEPYFLPNIPTRLTPISRAEGIYLLGQNSFNLDRFGAEGVSILTGAVSGAKCFRLRSGDLESGVRAVRDLVAGGSGVSGSR